MDSQLPNMLAFATQLPDAIDIDQLQGEPMNSRRPIIAGPMHQPRCRTELTPALFGLQSGFDKHRSASVNLSAY
jgi:hypothetical protein